MDKGYDTSAIHAACDERDCARSSRSTDTAVVSAASTSRPSCEHGIWTFAGSDYKRERAKWRCPTGECKPASVWIKADRLHPLIPRETKRWKRPLPRPAAVEREFGRLKHQWGLAPLRVRGLERVGFTPT